MAPSALERERKRSGILQTLEVQLKEIGSLVADHPDLTELFMNEDGDLWVRIGGVTRRTNVHYTPDHRTGVIRLLAGLQRQILDSDHPSIGTKLPLFGGLRVQALIPPIVDEPTITLRVPSRKIITLDEMAQRGTISKQQVLDIRNFVAERKTIVVAGSTDSGKTTLLKSILREVLNDRVYIIEDNPELEASAPNQVRVRTNPTYTMNMAIFDSLRQSPDRIILGEIRTGFVALEFCKAAANTGHTGSMATIHASSAEKVHRRFENLMTEVVRTPDKELIAEALDVCIFVEKVQQEGRLVRKVTSIIERSKEHP